MKPTTRRYPYLTTYLHALDVEADRSTLAALAVAFPHLTQILPAHYAGRVPALAHSLQAGGQPIGIIGYRSTPPTPWHVAFQRTPDTAHHHLKELSRAILDAPPTRTRFVNPLPPVGAPPPGAVPTTPDILPAPPGARGRVAVSIAGNAGPVFLYPDEPDSASALGRYVESGALPIGLITHPDVPCHLSTGNEDLPPCHACFSSGLFSAYAAVSWAQEYLRCAVGLLQNLCALAGGDPRLIVPLGGPGPSRRAADYLPELERAAEHVLGAGIVVALEVAADFVPASAPDPLARLQTLLAWGGIPLGLLASARTPQGLEARSRPFAELAENLWVREYLAALADRLQQHLHTLGPHGAAALAGSAQLTLPARVA